MTRRKKGLAYLLVVVMLIGIVNFSNMLEVQAQSITKAKVYSMGTNQSGVFTENGDEKQYYKFSLSSSGKVHLTGNAYVTCMEWYIYDQNLEEVWYIQPSWNSTSEVLTLDENLYLTSGTYYLCAEQRDGYGKFQFKMNFTSSNESFPEKNGGSNNTLSSAGNIELNGKIYKGQLALNDEKDFYKFTLTNSGLVKLNATFYKIGYVRWALYDENGEELLFHQPDCNSTTEDIVIDEELYLTSGSYYLAFICGSECSNYNFSAKFTSSNETYIEKNGGTNNSIPEASPLLIGTEVIGQIALNDEKDIYKFSVSTKKGITTKIDSLLEALEVRLFDYQGNEIWNDTAWCNETTQKISWNKVTLLEPGTYYLAISQCGSDRCGNYNLVVSMLTQENCPHDSYDTSWHDATYFSKGYELHKCPDCGYSYKDNFTLVLKLSQGMIDSYSSTGGKGSLQIYWDTDSDASGYQIRYCKNRRGFWHDSG